MSGSLTNNYAEVISPELYERLPKAVLAALLVSVLSNGGDNFATVERQIVEEWDNLYVAEIVPQKPPQVFLYDEPLKSS